MVGAGIDDGTTGDGQCDDTHDQETVPVVGPTGQPAGERDGASTDHTGRDDNQGGLQGGEAEGFDDEVAEVLCAAVGDLGQHCQGEEMPRLGVAEAFDELRPFPGGFLCPTGTCDHGTMRHELSFLGGEERGSGDAIREEGEEDESPQKGGYAEDDEHPHPGMQGMVNVANAIGEQTGDEPADRVAREPDARAEGNLIAGVPRRGEEHEGRRDGGLRHPEKESHGQQTAVVGTGGREGYYGTPEPGIDGEVLGDGHPGDQHVGWLEGSQLTCTPE